MNYDVSYIVFYVAILFLLLAFFLVIINRYFSYKKNEEKNKILFIIIDKGQYITTFILITLILYLLIYPPQTKEERKLLHESNSTSILEGDTVLLDVPIIRQPQQYACNVTAASIALQYKGIDVTPEEVFANIPKESIPKGDGKWGNPNLGFVGDVRGPTGKGYGIHWGPIADYISQYRPVEIKNEWNVTDMLNEIDKGNVSILWWQNGSADPDPVSWQTKDEYGNTVTIETVNGMHSEVVAGYTGTPENPSQIIISDPWASRWDYKYRYVDIDYFKELWEFFDNTAILVM